MEQIKAQILALAEACLEAGNEERPENQWLKKMYDRFREKHGNLRKAEADVLIYTSMYGTLPAKKSDTLKIRYWRTGRHLPVNRSQCLAFGRALELSEEEMGFLVKEYYDRSDLVFEEETEAPLYQSRRKFLEGLTREYLLKISPAVRRQMFRSGSEMEHSLRHIYYMDALGYLHARALEEMKMERHILSINYESEFSRQMRLLGEIPRKTMIRHLFLLGMPYISRELMNERLCALGYVPLKENHTQVDGSRLDRLILGVLELYEQTCTGENPENCMVWFRQAYGILDGYLKEQKNSSLRFLYFKTLGESKITV